jgi:tRNA(Ser,Leu) C12 N-acetylase TAN1
MRDWNAIASVREDCYKHGRRLLKAFGTVDKTEYYNVLGLKAADASHLAESLRQAVAEDPAFLQCVSRVVPVTHTFTFSSPAEFEARAKESMLALLPSLAGKAFHVRMHRRGFHEQLSSQQEEQILDRYILEQLAAAGSPGHITFSDPDAIIAVETIGQWAGVSLWTRNDLARYSFLGLD